IVPNSDLISGQLVNWTHSDARRRLELVVGTSYGASPERVLGILMKVVRTQPGVMSDPPADVLCIAFGESSIDFAIRAWTAGYLDAIQIKSRLALRVYEALEKEGIEIPFPQRDFHLRTVYPEAAEALRNPPE
ncbi:mechanosensitive ion channel, partial [bacterium]|nr:mechanosensitive ion channel [bacterium]